MRRFLLECIGFVLWMLFMWLVRIMDAFDKRNYPLLLFCFVVPQIMGGWLGLITFAMYSVDSIWIGLGLGAAAFMFASLGGLAVVNSTSKEGKKYLENLAKNPR